MSAPTKEFLRLAYIAGIPDWSEAQLQASRTAEIPLFVQGNIEDAWAKCLPEWVAFGRVRDLSLCVRVPKCWPSFASCLGRSFVEQFRDDYEFLTRRLVVYAVDSTEYLCVCDLIENMLHEHVYDESRVKDLLFGLSHALHPVIQFECQQTADYAEHSGSIGQFLQRVHSLDYED